MNVAEVAGQRTGFAALGRMYRPIHDRPVSRQTATRRFLVALSLALFALVLIPAAADARYYMSRGEAQSFMRDHLHQEGYTNTQVYCRPQGLRRPRPGYLYHRWVCDWIVNYEPGVSYDCEGRTLIVGSRVPDRYYARNDEAHGNACIRYH